MRMIDSQAQTRRLSERDGLSRLLGVEYVDGGPGRATLRMTVKPEHLNFYGGGHGGTIFAFADMAFGLSSNSHAHMAFGVNAQINYFVAVREGDVLTANGIEVSRSRSLATYRVDVTRQDDKLVASFTGMVHVTDKPVPE
jgi:phenylacetic acid degradation protein PaaD